MLFVLIFSALDRYFEFQKNLVAESHIVEALSTRVNAHLKNLISEFLILKSSAELLQYADNEELPLKLKGVQDRFLSFADATQHYDQIRLLDIDGKEVVRVNFSGHTNTLVKEKELQNKSHRPYFQNALSLDSNNLYVSPLDLNIENGIVQKPWKPMIRLGGLIKDSKGNPKGVLVLNYLAEHLLRELSRLNMMNSGSIMLLNEQGYWLYAENKEQLWGFMFKNNKRFGNDFPKEWKHISSRESDQLNTDTGTFTHKTISFPSIQNNIKAETKWVKHWKIVSLLPKELSTPQADKRFTLLVMLTPLALLFLTWIAWHWSKASVAANIRQQRIKELSRVVEQSEELVYITDKKGIIKYVNPAFETITGYKSHEVIGKSPRILKSGNHDDAFYQKLWKTIKSGKPFQDVIVNKRKNGSLFYEEKLITPIHDEKNGKIIQFVSTGRDISQMYRIKEKLDTYYNLAYQDQLTGLRTRYYLDEQLPRAMYSADRLEKLIALLFIDLDGFKDVNDSLGHDIGDLLLKDVAERLKNTFRKTDTVVRLGGDEFIVIMEYLDQVKPVEEFAENLIEEISKPFNYERTVTITASIGISIYPFEDLKPDELIKQADKAMYLAKNHGKNNYSFYSKC